MPTTPELSRIEENRDDCNHDDAVFCSDEEIGERGLYLCKNCHTWVVPGDVPQSVRDDYVEIEFITEWREKF